MKKCFPFLLAAVFGLAPTPASAGPYLSGALGNSFTGSATFDERACDLKQCMVLAGAVGYDFELLRLELGVDYQAHSYVGHPDWGELSFLTFSLNGYLDIPAGMGVKPYVMAGAGVSDAEASNRFVDTAAFAWQAGAGVGVPLSSHLTADLGYRIFLPVNVRSREGETVHWHSNNLLAGIRFSF